MTKVPKNKQRPSYRIDATQSYTRRSTKKINHNCFLELGHLKTESCLSLLKGGNNEI